MFRFLIAGQGTLGTESRPDRLCDETNWRTSWTLNEPCDVFQGFIFVLSFLRANASLLFSLGVKPNLFINELFFAFLSPVIVTSFPVAYMLISVDISSCDELVTSGDRSQELFFEC